MSLVFRGLDKDALKKTYTHKREQLQGVRARLRRPLCLSEKILFSHLQDPQQPFERGKAFLKLWPDRVALQDATAQMALLQFMLAGQKQTAVPSSVHCDHLIQAYRGESDDLVQARLQHNEVYNFLSSASKVYGLDFWGPGSGIIHQVVLENYAFPGGLLLGTDSHTPNAGGLGMLAIGVGGADAAEVMAALPWEVKQPWIVGVHLKGSLSGWSAPKDIILKLCGLMTVKGGTNKIIEYFGPGCESISCTGKGTITNMGAELGATCSVFPWDSSMQRYLKATQREHVALLAQEHQEQLCADAEVLQDPHNFYDEVIEIDLSSLEPYVVGPHSPDAARPVSELKAAAQKHKWPLELSAALVGSCTNSSYEDIGRAVHVAKQALEAGVKMPQVFMLSPGSMQIKKTIQRDGYMQTLEQVGATVLANACGPCIGQWRRDNFKRGQVNTIISSFNRNFRGRNDANPETLSFLASPEITMAIGLAGRLDFNPLTDELQPGLKLLPPEAPELPEKGFLSDFSFFTSGAKEDGSTNDSAAPEVKIDPHSRRLQKLKNFKPLESERWSDVRVFKVEGKCTTDHISPAGSWLRFRGHLDNISDNMLSGATNAWTKERGTTLNLITGQADQAYAQVARSYQAARVSWMIVGEDNYGEGSSREHAAMSPRFLGCLMVLAKSFARIHETNLKKQGILPLVFTQPEDYDLFAAQSHVSVREVEGIEPGKNVELIVQTRTAPTQEQQAPSEQVPCEQVHRVVCAHSLNPEQVLWFHHGSALNAQKAKHSHKEA